MINLTHKKIFIAADIFPPEIGGPATYSSKLSQELAEQGIEVRVLFYGKKSKQRMEVPFKIYRVSRRWPMPWRYFLYFIKLFFLSYNFPVIYAQGPVAAGLPSLIVKKLLDKRVVVKVVGDYAWEQAQLSSRTRQGVDEWQQSPQFKTHLPRRIEKINILNLIEKKVVRGVDKIIVPSHYLRQMVLGWGADKDKVEVIYNAIAKKCLHNISGKEEAKQKIGVSGDILISVGRFVPWKGFDFLIKLMPEILKINPDFKLIIVGDGFELSKYQKIIQQMGLLEKVFLPGRLDRRMMCLYFMASEMFLLNSGYEGLSHVILEAMKHELPVIVSDKGGNPEVVDNEITGMLVRYNNEQAWLETIKRVWRDKALRERLSKSQTAKLPCFDFESMVERTVEVLTSN